MTTSSGNNSIFRDFFEKQKLTGPNFIDWYRQLKVALSIEDKLNYLEQLISPAPVAPAKRLGHPMTLGLGISLILIGLRKEYDGFVQNYNTHSMGKTINELHAMLKLHEQTLPKNYAPAFHAIRAGHCKRNCPKYLAELLKKKKNATSGAGGSDGFINCFVNNTIQVSRNNMVYFSAIPRDGVFEIDLSNSYTNESSIYVVSNKRAKLDLDSALLWHCRVGHISKKRIEKLQHDGLFNSTDLRAFEKCISCPQGHDMPPDRMCLYIDAEEHELGNLGEPAYYKDALLDLEYDKWLNAMNVEMQSMKDNE
nr:zinc finger, CCHC-type [Tanacetum cinerariifolium]